MKANKKTKPQRMGHWKGMSCNNLTKAGCNYALPFGINFMLASSPQLNSALFSCPQLFAPAQAVLLGLAQLEAQLVLNQLRNIAVGDHSGYYNTLLPSILHTYLSQHVVPLSLCQPPRAASYPLLKTSHTPSNSASDTVCQQMSTGIFPSVSTDKLETANAKYQSGTGVMGAPQVEEQMLSSFLGKDKKAFLHMLKKEDTEALSKCQNLTICNKVITVVPHHQKPIVHTDGSQRKIVLQQPMVLKERSTDLCCVPDCAHQMREREMKCAIRKGVILISGIPFDYSEDDLIQLVTPFGQPIKILIATEVDMDNDLDWKMALVVLSNELSAHNIVQVYSVVPVHLKQFDVTPVPQTVDFRSSVSLFQAFTAPRDPTGSLTPWSHLLVVSNVPDQPHIAPEVLHLVQPFSKVLRTLVLPEEKVSNWNGLASDENCRVKHHDLSPWSHESVEGILVLISGFPETTDSEDDFIQMAAPHGVPTKVVIAAAQRKALVELPDKHSAKKMVVAYNAIPTGLKQLDMKLLPDTVDINKPVSLFQVIMGPEHPGGKATDPHLLLTAGNVPDTVGGISQVQQLVQRHGAVNRTLILNTMVIFEMITSKVAKVAYKQLKKLPYTAHRGTLSFVWGSDPSVTEKEDAEDVPFDVDIPDFVSVDEVSDVTAFQSNGIPLLAESFTSTQPNRQPDTNMAGYIRTTEGIQHFPFSGNKGKQTYGKTKDAKCQRNQKGRGRGQEQQDGAMNNVRLTSSNISDSPAVVENQVKIQMKTKQPHVTGLIHRRKCLLEKVKTFLKRRKITRPVFPEGYSLMPFNPECPVGTEFLEQRSSFYCKVCKKFSVGDEEVKDIHCRSFRHYKNLERCLQNWLQKRSCSEQDKRGR
ncbi:hypothetical protein AOLI_G00016480 [Acnodon oligacanthus]